MSDVSDGEAVDGVNLTDVPPATSPLKSPGSGGGSLAGGSDDEGAPGMELDLDGEDMDDEITIMMGGWTCINCTVANPDHRELCMLCKRPKGDDPLAIQVVPPPPPPPPCVVAFDERMLLHEEQPDPERPNKPPHPERPDRLRAILNRLQATGIFPGRCDRLPSREVTREEMLMCHTEEHVDLVEAASEMASAGLRLNQDTYVSKDTTVAARLACGAAVDVALALAAKQATHGAALVRPPGHHVRPQPVPLDLLEASIEAERAGIMGFCLCNNACVAARAAQKVGFKKVLIVDWDVHHGNGTQNMFYSDPSVLYISLHRGNFYPGTGRPDETGRGEGMGFNVNIAWRTGGVADGDYMAAFTSVVLPVAHAFQPDLTIISAGFDAAIGDPIGGCNVSPAAYAHMTAMLKPLAPVELLLEGGYNLTSISLSTEACMRVLLGEEPPRLPEPPVTTELGLEAIKRTVQLHSKHWPILVDTAERAQQSSFGIFRNFFRMVRGHEPDEEGTAGGRASGSGDTGDSDSDGGHDASGGKVGVGDEPERSGGNASDDEDEDDDGDNDGEFPTPRATSDELPGKAAGQQGEDREQADGAEGAVVRSERPDGSGAQREAGGSLAASKGISKHKDGLSLTPATLEAIVAQDAAKKS